MVTVPCDGAVCEVTVSPLPRSFARTDEPINAVLAAVDPMSPTARGVTVTTTVAVLVLPAASVAV